MAIIKRTNSDYSIQTPTGSNITLQTDNILVTNNIITSGNITTTGTITATGGIVGSSTFGVAGILYANAAVDSTSNTSGGLITTGGAAVGGNLYVGKNLVVTGNLNVLGTQTVFSTNNTSFADSIIYLADNNTANILDLGIISSFTNGFYQHTGLVRDATDGVWKLFANVAVEPTTTVDFTDAIYSALQVGSLNSTLTTAATNSTTGAIVTAGGLGVAGAAFIGTTLNTIGETKLTGKLYANSAIASTSTATGAITTAGGVGIAGDVFVGSTLNTTGKIYSNSAITSTSTTTGAITTAGGLGVAGNINIGQNASIAGNAAVTGNVTVGNLEIVAKNMLLNSALGTGTAPSGTVGITVNRGLLANVQIRYTEDWQTWQITNNGSTYANISTTTGSGIYMQNVSDDLFPSLGANLNTVSFTIKSTAGNIRIDSNITPVTTSVYDIGSSALKFANVNAVSMIATNLTGTLQTAAQTNITSVGTLTGLTSSGIVNITNATTSTSTGTGALVVSGGIGVTGNINIASTIASTSTSTGALVVGGGLGVAGAIFSTSVSATNLTGTLQTAAQPNITSVGTLTSLVVSGTTTINSGNAVTAIINGGTTGIGNIGASGQIFNTVFATSFNGTLVTAAQTNITSVGTLTSLTTSGTTTVNSGNAVTAIINGGTTGVGNIGASGQIFNTIFATSLSGTLTTVAQPNITSVGTLSALTVSATISGSVSGSAATVTGATQSAITSVGTLTSLTTSGVITVNSGNAVTAIINGGTTGVGNIGSVTTGFNTVYAKATSAVYADLAEIYTSDADYAPGTVVVFGGLFEVTESTTSHDSRVAGVVSTNPAYLMNDKAIGVAVALQGRVPCHVQGPIGKGDLVVASAIPGVACKLNKALYDHGCVIGKSLATITDTSIQIIEVVVGRV